MRAGGHFGHGCGVERGGAAGDHRHDHARPRAAAAGVSIGLYHIRVVFWMGTAPGLKAFVAAVFGGIGSIPGAMIGGLFIGIAETMVTAYGSSLYKNAIVYIILILILILKPAGLLGKNVREKV